MLSTKREIRELRKTQRYLAKGLENEFLFCCSTEGRDTQRLHNDCPQQCVLVQMKHIGVVVVQPLVTTTHRTKVCISYQFYNDPSKTQPKSLRLPQHSEARWKISIEVVV